MTLSLSVACNENEVTMMLSEIHGRTLRRCFLESIAVMLFDDAFRKAGPQD